MQKRIIPCIFISAIIISSQLISCKKDTVSPTCDGTNSTYTSNIKTIIDNNCLSSGCHGSGSSNGDFTTYEGLKTYCDNGKFQSQVLDNQTMPKGSSLSSDQLNKIQCWIDNGYPKN